MKLKNEGQNQAGKVGKVARMLLEVTENRSLSMWHETSFISMTFNRYFLTIQTLMMYLEINFVKTITFVTQAGRI